MVQHGGISPFKNPFKNPFKPKKTNFDTEIIADAEKYIQKNKTKLNYLEFKNKMREKFGPKLAEQLIAINKKEINDLFKKAAESQNRARNSRLKQKTAYGKLGNASPYVPASVGVNKGPSGIPAEKHSLKMIIYGILDENKSENTNISTVTSIIKNNLKFRDYAEQQPQIRSNIVRPNSTTPFKDLFGMDEDSFIKETYEEYKWNSQGGKKKSMKKKRTGKLTRKIKRKLTRKTKRKTMKKRKTRKTC